MQHGLSGDTEVPGGVVEREVPLGDLGYEPGADLVGETDAPGCSGCGLLGGKQALPEPAADCGRRDAELAGGVLDGEGLAVGVGRWRSSDASTLAGALDGIPMRGKRPANPDILVSVQSWVRVQGCWSAGWGRGLRSVLGVGRRGRGR